jgi:hypothetical protein
MKVINNKRMHETSNQKKKLKELYMKEKTKTIEVQGSYEGDHNKEMPSNKALVDYNKEHTIIKIVSFEEGSPKTLVIVGLWREVYN